MKTALFFKEILTNLQPFISLDRWVIAFSGGVDSSVLLHALVQLKKKLAIPELVAIHVNHGLQQQAVEWEQHCRRICQNFGVDLIIEKSDINKNHIKTYGVEQAARDSRYKIFNKHLQATDCLIQGHHKNDQAETILLRLCRGTGLDGLSGIPKTRKLTKAWLMRPMLNICRKQLTNYATANNISYINDPSNNDVNFNRNFIRHEILPKLESKWPKVIDRLVATAMEAKEVADIISVNVEQNLQNCRADSNSFFTGLYSGLSISKLKGFSLEDQCRIIRLWLKESKVGLPSRDAINKIITEVMLSDASANPKIKMGAYFVRRYLDNLLLVSVNLISNSADIVWDWQKKPSITINGLNLAVVDCDVKSKLSIKLPSGPVVIKFRPSIDPTINFAIANRNCSKNLKKLMQEYQVPPWLRDNIPLLFVNNEMIAAPDLWVCDKYKATKQPMYWCKMSLDVNQT